MLPCSAPHAVAPAALALIMPCARFTDYSWSLRGLDGAALAEAKSACHLRSARKLVDVAFANGAIYIKAGQHIGQLVRRNRPQSALYSAHRDYRCCA